MPNFTKNLIELDDSVFLNNQLADHADTYLNKKINYKTISSFDVKQVEDHACFLLADLKTLAGTNPKIIENLIHDNHPESTVTVTLYATDKNGQKVPLNFNIPKTPIKLDYKSQPWVRYVEKAVALSGLVRSNGKIPNDFINEDLDYIGNNVDLVEQLDGGDPNLAMQFLLPGKIKYAEAGKEIDEKITHAPSEAAARSLFKRTLKESFDKKFPVTAHVDGHAVAVGGIKDVNGVQNLIINDQLNGTSYVPLDDIFDGTSEVLNINIYPVAGDATGDITPQAINTAVLHKNLTNNITNKDVKEINEDAIINELFTASPDIPDPEPEEEESEIEEEAEEEFAFGENFFNNNQPEIKEDLAVKEESQVNKEESLEKTDVNELENQEPEIKEAEIKAEPELNEVKPDEQSINAEIINDQPEVQEEEVQLKDDDLQINIDEEVQIKEDNIQVNAEEEKVQIRQEDLQSEVKVEPELNELEKKEEAAKPITDDQIRTFKKAIGKCAEQLEKAKTLTNSKEYKNLITMMKDVATDKSKDLMKGDTEAATFANQVSYIHNMIDKYLDHKAMDGVKPNVYKKLLAVETSSKVLGECIKALGDEKITKPVTGINSLKTVKELNVSYKQAQAAFKADWGERSLTPQPKEKSEIQAAARKISSNGLEAKTNEKTIRRVDNCLCKIQLKAQKNGSPALNDIINLRDKFLQDPPSLDKETIENTAQNNGLRM